MTRSSLRLPSLHALLLTLALAPPAAGQNCPDPAAILAGRTGPEADVRYLADDALAGREVGTPGERCAADYLVERFVQLGLRPGGEDGGWFHTFPVPAGAALGPDNLLQVAGDRYASGREWIPLGFSARTSAEAALAYGGHLLSRPGHPDDQFTRADLRGRIVVAEWGDPAAPSGGGFRSDPHFKATIAAGRGAAGLVVLLPEGAELPDPAAERRTPLAIPVAVAGGDAAAALRTAARSGAAATLRTDVSPTTVEARNVVAVLPGAHPELRDEYVVVGAHYDHLGMGGDGSLDPDAVQVHNGADDNASGTAGMVEIARRLSDGARPSRSVVFIAFTGEEKGLWGSARWVRHPTRPLENAVAMINLDMVGRLQDDALLVFGTGTATEWESVLSMANRMNERPLSLAFNPDGYGPSDHASFFAAGIPVLHFFTSTHAEYHRPEDDWELINVDGIRRVAALGATVVRLLTGEGPHSVTLTPVTGAEPAAHAGGSAQEDTPSRGYGPYLGTIPDMTPREGGGLRLTGVREGSPAENAGLQAGDVVVRFDGKEVTDIYTYTYALRDRAPGDSVEIVVERDGQRLTMTAVLGSRD